MGNFTETFSEVHTQERTYITQRRNEIKFTDDDWKFLKGKIDPLLAEEQRGKHNYNEGTIGLALSGGGIRSATFNLGLLQALAKQKLLRFSDYLSTVSGGGYIGSCLSSLLDNPEASTEYEKFPFRFNRRSTPETTPDETLGEERQEVKWLREHGNYLEISKNPFRFTFWRSIGLYLSGLVLVNLTTAAIVMTVTFGLYRLVKAYNYSEPALLNLAWIILMVALGVFGLMVICRSGFAQHEFDLKGRRVISRMLGVLTWTAAMVASVSGLIYLAVYLPNLQSQTQEWIQTALDIGLLGSLCGFLFGMPKNNNKTAQKVFAIIFRISSILLLPLLFAVFIRWLWSTEITFLGNTIWGFPLVPVIALGLLIVSCFIDVDRISLHHFYRDRLSEAYLFTFKKGKMQDNEEKLIKDLHEAKNGAPYHLINATLNIPSSHEPRLRGRKSDFFLFSKYYCGAASTGYRRTTDYNDGSLRLATAMAISGAAASPQMGELLSGTGTFVFTLLNIRLDRWMPNPNPKYGIPLWLKCAPYYFMKELLGRGDEDDRLLNLSDGGHIENLAVYQLIKRRCKLIIASDSGADPDFSFGDLANFIRKVRIDLGADIDLKLHKLRLNADRLCELHYASGTIEYADGTTGVLIYIRPSIDGNEPEDILGYRRNNLTFPNQTTLDQIFEEDQFESYRALGYFAGRKIFA